MADTSISGLRVARELSGIVGRRGRPQTIVSDNGTELTSNAILTWADDMQIGWNYIAPGKPQQNGYNESFPRPPARRAFETRRCSARCTTPGPCWTLGGATTTSSGRTRSPDG